MDRELEELSQAPVDRSTELGERAAESEEQGEIPRAQPFISTTLSSATAGEVTP